MAARKFISLCEADTKKYRQKIKLPVTKTLIYYRGSIFTTFTTIKVEKYEIVEEYQRENNYWAILKLYLKDGTTVNIHSAYFAQMQKPSFIKDLIEEAEQMNKEE